MIINIVGIIRAAVIMNYLFFATGLLELHATKQHPALNFLVIPKPKTLNAKPHTTPPKKKTKPNILNLKP